MCSMEKKKAKIKLYDDLKHKAKFVKTPGCYGLIQTLSDHVRTSHDLPRQSLSGLFRISLCFPIS